MVKNSRRVKRSRNKRKKKLKGGMDATTNIFDNIRIQNNIQQINGIGSIEINSIQILLNNIPEESNHPNQLFKVDDENGSYILKLSGGG